MGTITINVAGAITIDIPALDALVRYLQSRVDSQKQIDALTAQVTELTAALQKSAAGLNQAVKP